MTQGFKKCFGVDFNLEFSFELHLLNINRTQLKASHTSEKDSILPGRNVDVLLRVINTEYIIIKLQMPEMASLL